MTKEASITVRVPAALKSRLARRAKREHRSVSAQVLVELERAFADESAAPSARASALGLFAGAALPSDEDLQEIRAALWGRLGEPRG